MKKTLPIAFPEQRWYDVDELHGHTLNYKRHPLGQLLILAQDLARFGQRKPVVIQVDTESNVTIVAGAGLSGAIKWLKDNASTSDLEWVEEWYKRVDHTTIGQVWTTLVPSEWGEEEIVGYLVADNETARGAEDDTQMLAEILDRQQKAGYSIESIGFKPGDYKDLLRSIQQVATLGVRHKESIEGSLDAYVYGSVRQLMMLYEKAEYIFVLAKATKLREFYGVETNSEMFALLLDEGLKLHDLTIDDLQEEQDGNIAQDNRVTAEAT